MHRNLINDSFIHVHCMSPLNRYIHLPNKGLPIIECFSLLQVIASTISTLLPDTEHSRKDEDIRVRVCLPLKHF